jgi:mitochondrial fission protein ELM1
MINKNLINSFTFVNDRKLDLNNKKLLLILVGCKNDYLNQIENRVQVTSKEATKFAKENGFSLFFETSSRDRYNIKTLLEHINMELISNYVNYLKFNKEIFDDIAINSFPSTRYSVIKGSMSLNALTTQDQVYFNCSKEKLNVHNLLINISNSKRKNLQTKSFFDFL